MNRFIFALILTLSISAFVYSQQNKTETKAPEAQKSTEAKTETKTEQPAPEGNIYHEITVEDFENIDFKDSDIIFQRSGAEEEYKVAVRDENPAPINNSKKYLGVKLRGTKYNAIQIKFPATKTPTIDKYVQSISMWVYGKNFTGDLYLLINDAVGQSHRLLMGRLNFHGWHKLTKILPAEVAQTDKMLEQKSNIKILSIIYVPGTSFKAGTNIMEPSLQTFYVDDITANVREKYKDVQNDEW